MRLPCGQLHNKVFWLLHLPNSIIYQPSPIAKLWKCLFAKLWNCQIVELTNYLCTMAKFFLRKKIGDRILGGHPWVFANELGDSEGDCAPGDIVELYSYNG